MSNDVGPAEASTPSGSNANASSNLSREETVAENTQAQANQRELVIETSHLSKRYGEFVALDELNLNVRRGQILGLIGPNGAGKTTTIKILVGLAKPSSGTAKIAGADCVKDARRIKRLVGYMPDRFGSYENMRVHEYLDFFGAAFGISRRKRVARIEEVLEITSATYMRDRYVESLSHGMQQRIGIARTLLHDPEVLIFDEPANGLDPQARVEMRELLLHLGEIGKTLIVTSHILPELSRICDQVAILSQGQLKAYGSVDEIMRQVTPARLLEIGLQAESQLLQAAELIAKFEHLPDSIQQSEAERTIRFQTTMQENDWSQVISTLVGAGVAVTQFREIQTDLENAYLSVTSVPGSQAKGE